MYLVHLPFPDWGSTNTKNMPLLGMFFMLEELGWGRMLVKRRKKEKGRYTLYACTPFAITAFPTLSLLPLYHSLPPCCLSHPVVWLVATRQDCVCHLVVVVVVLGYGLDVPCDGILANAGK